MTDPPMDDGFDMIEALEAHESRVALTDHARGRTHWETALARQQSAGETWRRLQQLQAIQRAATVADQRHDMVERLILAEEVLSDVMLSRYVKVAPSGAVVMTPTGRKILGPDGDVQPEYKPAEDPTPRIQAAAALARVTAQHSKLIGADTPAPLVPPDVLTHGSIEDEIARLSAELGYAPDGHPG